MIWEAWDLFNATYSTWAKYRKQIAYICKRRISKIPLHNKGTMNIYIKLVSQELSSSSMWIVRTYNKFVWGCCFD